MSNISVGASQITTAGGLPNIASQFANLPNVKLVPINKSFPDTTTGHYDYYTVPSGRRALLSTITVNNPSFHGNSQVTASGESACQSLLKVSGSYYQLSAATTVPASSKLFLATNPYIAEAGETFSVSPMLGAINNAAAVVESVVAPTVVAQNITNGLVTNSSAATLTVGSNAGYVNGATVLVAGITNANFTQLNGTWVIQSTTATTIVIGGSGWTARTSTALSAGTVTQQTSVTFPISSVLVQNNGLTTYVMTAATGITFSSYLGVGRTVTITGFSNAGNNGTFQVLLTQGTGSFSVINPGGVAETASASGSTGYAVYTIYYPNAIPTTQAMFVTVSGCTNAGNNGTFQFSTGAAGAGNGYYATMYINNASGVTETAPAGAQMVASTPFTVNAWIVEFDNTAALRSSKLLAPAASVTPATLYTPSAGKSGGMLVNIGDVPSTGSIFASNPIQGIALETGVFYVSGSSVSVPLANATSAANGYTVYYAALGTLFGSGDCSTLTAVTPVAATYALTAVALGSISTDNGANYSGTFPAANIMVGQMVAVTGFVNAVNNGTFLCLANSTTTMTLLNPFTIAETNPGTAAFTSAYTVYTVSATPNAGTLMGQYYTVNGCATANNGTFQCIGNLGTSIYLANASGTTQSPTTGTLVCAALSGLSVTISGFTNPGNNGTFTCAGSTPWALILSNTGGVAESNANGVATFSPPAGPGNFIDSLVPAGANAGTVVASASGTNLTIKSGDSLEVVNQFPYTGITGCPLGMLWCNVVEF